jgi:hypothetical protein
MISFSFLFIFAQSRFGSFHTIQGPHLHLPHLVYPGNRLDVKDRFQNLALNVIHPEDF